MSTIWFIRHMESQSNAGLSTLAPCFTSLTGKGKDQAKKIADLFYKPPSLIITSKFRRAKQTAQATVDRFPFVPYEEWPTVHEFTYLSNPRCSCMTAQDRRPMVEAYWESCDPDIVDGEGAESFTDFMKRVSTALELLQARKEDFIAVFTHGQFMRAVWWLLHNTPSRMDSDSMKRFKDLLTSISIPNGGILPVEFLSKDETYIRGIIIPHFDDERNEEGTLGVSFAGPDNRRDYFHYNAVPATPAFHQ